MSKKLLKQMELKRRLEAGLTKEDSEWLDKFERLMKKAPAGIKTRMEAFTTGESYITVTPTPPSHLFEGNHRDYCMVIQDNGIYYYEVSMPFFVHSTAG